jgi:phosphate-selective porin
MSRVKVIAFALLAAVASAASAQAKPKAVFVISNMANESQAFAAKQFLKYGAEFGFDVQTFDAKGDRSSRSSSSTRTTSTPSSPAS